jgi:hypothetical protein
MRVLIRNFRKACNDQNMLYRQYDGLKGLGRLEIYSPITYYWTGFLILDHSYLVGNLTNSKIAETKALEPPKS